MRIFDFFTKRKQKHSVSLDAVKEQNNVLLKRLEKVESELGIASFVGTTNERHVLTDVERLFLRYFSIPEREGEGAFMSGPEIMQELEKHSQKTMAGVTANAFGRSMTRLGVRRVGHHDTDGYWVLAA